MITPDEFLNLIKEAKVKFKNKVYDEEVLHMKMDDILCMALIDLGFEEGVMEFLRTPKWYS